MNKTFNIHYNNSKIENKYAESLAKSIIDLGLRKGEKVRSYPFNLFDDENTSHKIDPLKYQCVPLYILEIEYSFIDSWNGNVRTVIDITIGNH
tara:strand:- start:4203 stop:4481 length:279 start_codon:yes stop_codon:yes gene_type:complete